MSLNNKKASRITLKPLETCKLEREKKIVRPGMREEPGKKRERSHFSILFIKPKECLSTLGRIQISHSIDPYPNINAENQHKCSRSIFAAYLKEKLHQSSVFFSAVKKKWHLLR